MREVGSRSPCDNSGGARRVRMRRVARREAQRDDAKDSVRKRGLDLTCVGPQSGECFTTWYASVSTRIYFTRSFACAGRGTLELTRGPKELLRDSVSVVALRCAFERISASLPRDLRLERVESVDPLRFGFGTEVVARRVEP